MKPTLVPGLRNHQRHVVTESLTTAHAGPGVLATPSMIGLVEWCCLEATADHVDQGEATVGIHVCVSHESAVAEGESIDVSCELVEVDGRTMVFEVAVDGPRGPVSRGTHGRAVVRARGAAS